LNEIFKTKDVDYILAGDTDSVYVNVQKFVDMKPELTDDEDIEKYLNNICERLLEPKIKEIYECMFEYMSFFENTMHMKREVIAKGAFWTGAKNYAMLVFNDEGKRYDPPKMKIMGIKVVRSDTPNAVKGMLKQFIEKVLFSAPIKEFVDECKKTILNFDSSKLNKPSGVNVLNDYFIEGQSDPREATKKGAPFQSKEQSIITIFLRNLQ
jgi:DNA polymerase elongation subunit (family B)